MYPSPTSDLGGVFSLEDEKYLKQNLRALSTKLRCPLLSVEAIRPLQDSSVRDCEEQKYFFDFAMVLSFNFSIIGPLIRKLGSV